MRHPSDDDWRLTEDERRASFEVVDLEALPPDGIECEPSPWWSQRTCGCRHCRGDWRQIAALSIKVLERGMDPLDRQAIWAFGRNTLWCSRRDRHWLASLFYDPILVGRSDESYTNGRHRTHAMRLAGVKRAVIYTKAGERTWADP